MSRDEVLKRLCQMAAKVREHPPLAKKAGQSLAADCFCGQSAPKDPCLMNVFMSLSMDDYRFNDEVMAFIEAAVDRALQMKARR